MDETTMSDEQRDFYGRTAAEWIQRWDAGESIWSVSMGGLGPGYEQAIQVAAVETVRRLLDMPIPPEPMEKAEEERIAKALDAALTAADHKSDFGLSGAQAGAAKAIAYRMLRDGPAGVMESLKRQGISDRSIQVSNHWPRALPIAPEGR